MLVELWWFLYYTLVMSLLIFEGMTGMRKVEEKTKG